MSNGLLRVTDNAGLDAEQAEQDGSAEQENNKQFTSEVAAHIAGKWDEAKNAKVEIEKRLLACARQRKNEYNPADLAIIREQGGSELFMSITSVKCRAIEAAMKDILIPAAEKAWKVKPTPVAEYQKKAEILAMQQMDAELEELSFQPPEELQGLDADIIRERTERLVQQIAEQQKQEAAEKIERQEKYIDDVLVQGKFEDAERLLIKDVATYPSGFIKGPLVRKRTELTWSEEQEDGQSFPEITEKLRREFARISPFDIYPSPSSKTLQDGDLIEKTRLRRKDLIACLGTPGFKDAAIMAVLTQYGEGGLKDWLWTEQEISTLNNRPQEYTDSTAVIEALIFNGDIQGQKLLDWGVDKEQVPKPNAEYSVSAWLIGEWVVCLRLNTHPLGFRGYYSTSFESVNDSIWGIAPPEIMRDCQKLCNSSARAIANNQSIASGPQVEVHKDRIDPGEDIENIYPWKIWKTKSDEQGHGRQAVYFYQPNPMTDSLMRVYEFFSRQAGDQLGIPAYEHGSTEVKGAGETAKGLQMLMSASSKIIKDVVRNVDKDIIEPIIAETWLHLVLTDGDMPDCGDIKIIARASEYMIALEQIQFLRRDWLAITNNPTDMAIIGLKGRAEVLRETASQLKMDTNNIIPGMAEIAQIEQQQQEQSAMEQQSEPQKGK